MIKGLKLIFIKSNLVLLAIALLLGTTLYSCKPRDLNSQNLYKKNYQEEEQLFKNQLIAGHLNDTLSKVYYQVNPQYISQKISSLEGRVELITFYYKLYYLEKDKYLLIQDTLMQIDADDMMNLQDTLIEHQLPLMTGNNYFVIYKIMDSRALINHRDELIVYKENHASLQWYLITDEQGKPLFRNHLNSLEQFRIQSGLGADKLAYVKAFDHDPYIAVPPFTSLKPNDYILKAREEYNIASFRNIDGSFRLREKGIYHFSADDESDTGLVLFNFNDQYPYVVTTGQMVESLRYITSSKEYKSILNSPEPKKQLDEFWIKMGKNPDRARRLIKEYYTQVETANDLFISHTQGWKTDRGMIFIIYGPPDAVFADHDSETWVYGEAGNSRSLRFEFLKIENPLTDNDYQLVRDPLFKNTWYIEVSKWRK